MNLKSARLFVLIALEYLKRNLVWLAAGAGALIILVFLQVKLNLFYSPNVLRIGLIGTYQEHDLPLDITRLVSTGLVETSSDGKIKPNLVTGWEVNNDATQFKFKLKNNLKWIDNTPIKSSDLDFAIPNITISYPDEQTIQFNLKESYSPLPSLLTKPVFKKGTLIGTGPYRIAKVEKSRIFITKITLQSNNPELPAVYARFYPNEKVAITGFNLGEVEVLLELSNPKAIPANSITGVKQKTDYSKIVTVFYQTTDSLLRSRSLRQALSYETPQIRGEESANNPYPPNFWAYNSDSKKYLANPKEAAAALERAKSSMSDDQLHSELILITTPNLEEVGRVIVQSWKKLGFDSKLRVESGIPQNFQALLITQSIPIDPDQYFLWHATQTKTNLTKYDSKRVDKDLEDGRKIITEDDRKLKYFDFQKTLLEDAPAVFLYFPKYNIVYLKKVEPLLDKILSL
ncbi:MAG: ABC transporter substrate-binding protein [Candidatus Daviesbacteria bacterium]|nr:ABC transporter substrate-binding protein [Candidatus Daviesbacteria bacterium]